MPPPPNENTKSRFKLLSAASLPRVADDGRSVKRPSVPVVVRPMKNGKWKSALRGCLKELLAGLPDGVIQAGGDVRDLLEAAVATMPQNPFVVAALSGSKVVWAVVDVLTLTLNGVGFADGTFAELSGHDPRDAGTVAACMVGGCVAVECIVSRPDAATLVAVSSYKHLASNFRASDLQALLWRLLARDAAAAPSTIKRDHVENEATKCVVKSWAGKVVKPGDTAFAGALCTPNGRNTVWLAHEFGRVVVAITCTRCDEMNPDMSFRLLPHDDAGEAACKAHKAALQPGPNHCHGVIDKSGCGANGMHKGYYDWLERK